MALAKTLGESVLRKRRIASSRPPVDAGGKTRLVTAPGQEYGWGLPLAAANREAENKE
jgi:hypothetical protein